MLPTAAHARPARCSTTFDADITYRVDVTRRAARDLEVLYRQIRAAESLAAARWYNALEKAIRNLERLPRRCPVAPEAEKAKRQLRHLLYGRKPHVYRVLYEIDEPHKVVHVLTIRHGARDKFTEYRADT